MVRVKVVKTVQIVMVGVGVEVEVKMEVEVGASGWKRGSKMCFIT